MTFIADIRTAKIADLVVIKDDSVADGAMANTLRVKVTDAFGNALAGQTVSVLAGNGATTAPTVTTQPDGTLYAHSINVLPGAAVGQPVYLDADHLIQRNYLRRRYGLAAAAPAADSR